MKYLTYNKYVKKDTKEDVCIMGVGKPDKVSDIVDEIVKNNNIFKLKSSVEQNKEKDSIERSIHTALASRNEIGYTKKIFTKLTDKD